MKVLAMFVSLLFGAAVLALFLQPWELRRNAAKSPNAVAVAAPEPASELPPAAAPPQPAAPQVQVSPSATPQPVVPQVSEALGPAPKTTLLASEQAEAERLAALEQKHAVTPEPETKRYFKVKVRDAGTLEADRPNAGSVVIRLGGIDVRGADEECAREDGTVWPCGAKAHAALKLFIRSRAVTCTLPPGGEAGEFTSRCAVAEQDLATWLVRRGWAIPKDGEGAAFAEALAEAKAERIGLWEGD